MQNAASRNLPGAAALAPARASEEAIRAAAEMSVAV